MAGKVKKKDWLLDAHELFTEVPELRYRPEVRNIWEGVEQFIFQRLQFGYTVCESLASEFDKKYGVQLGVIRNFPAAGKNINSTFPTEKIILYRGAVNKGRGLEEMITAMQEIDAHLVIAGDGDIFFELKKMVRDLKLTKKVKLTGALLPKELDALSERAYFGINLLNRYSLSYYYSLANKFIDYVHLGLPQLGMHFPEYVKLNKQHEVALLVEDLNIKALVDASNALLNNVELHREMHLNCLKAKREWTWEEEEKELLAFYKKLPFNQDFQ